MNTEAGKPIRLSNHARGYLVRRGFTETEIHEAIHTSPWPPAHGTFYTTKRVWSIFVEETAEIVVVTVYTYFF